MRNLVSRILSYVLALIVPPRHMRTLVNGEIIRRTITRENTEGLLYAHSPTSLQCAHQLADGARNRIHFFPLSPDIRFHNNTAYFHRLSKRELNPMLVLLRSVKPSLRSIIAIGSHNASMARWWADWYALPAERRYFVKAAWAMDPRRLENQAFTLENRSRLRPPAFLILDIGAIRKFQLDVILKAFTKAHSDLSVIAITDTDIQTQTVKDIMQAYQSVRLDIIDRRTVKRWKRWLYLIHALTDQVTKATIHKIGTLWQNVRGTPPQGLRASSGRTTTQHLTPIASDPDPTFSDVMAVGMPKGLKHWTGTRRKITEQIGIFRENVVGLTRGMDFDIVISFDIISAPAGHDIAQMCRKDKVIPHMIDFNETLRFEERISDVFTSLSASDMHALYTTCFQAVSEAKLSTGSSERLAHQAEKQYGMPVTPVYNFHKAHPLKPKHTMRRDFNIPKTAVIIVHCCTYAQAYHSDKVIDVIAALPEHFHLVMVGHAATPDYEIQFKKQVQIRGLSERIHFKGAISPSAEYLAYLSTADISLILLNTDIATVRDGLANRFIDSLGAGLPMVSTHAYESADMIKTHDLGRVCSSSDPTRLAAEIMALDYRQRTDGTLPHRLEKARQIFNQDHESEKFLSLVKANYTLKANRNSDDSPPSAVFVFQRGLSRNKRILRLAQTLIDVGWSVMIISGSRAPAFLNESYPEIKFYRASVNKIWSDDMCARERSFYDFIPDNHTEYVKSS